MSLSQLNVLFLVVGAILGVVIALLVGYLVGYLYEKTKNRAQYEKSLRSLKEESERSLLKVQTEQREALREAREETALFRATIERENAVYSRKRKILNAKWRRWNSANGD